MRNAGLDETQAGIKFARRNINNLRYPDDTTLMVESDEKLKSLLMIVKEESEKSWLKTQHSENQDHGIWSHHFMGNRWETVKTVTDFILRVLKSLQMVTSARKLKDTCLLKEKV